MTAGADDARAWERAQGVECVSCPQCAFTFDAAHTTHRGDGVYEGYDCPLCAESALAALRATEKNPG